MDPTDLLSCISADLVSETRHRNFLRRLIASPKGEWQDLALLCADNDATSQLLADLGSGLEPIYVAWLPFEQATHGRAYCTIIFFAEAYHWHNVALFNTSTLD